MTLKCKQCGAEMSISKDGTKRICSYCGTTELIEDSDAVKIQRIKSKAYTEVELERQKLERARMTHKIENNAERKEERRLISFKKGKLSKILIVFAVISLLITILELSGGISIAGIIALIQTVLYCSAWLFGMQVFKTKNKNMHVLLTVISVVLIIPFFIAFMSSPSSPATSQAKDFVWSDIELHEQLPEPHNLYGQIISNSESNTSIYVHDISREHYKEYITMCEDYGYTIEAESIGDNYTAFNKNGYKISLWYNDTDKELHISLDVPEEMRTIEWPTTGIASHIPVPPSNIGRILYDNSESFIVHVGQIPQDVFAAYIKECESAGFSIDYSKTDEYYSAQDADRYTITLRYLGFNTVEISIRVPNSEKTDTASNTKEEPSETKKAENTTSHIESTQISIGIRKEFKEALDSYEKFFDDYIAFIEKYEEAGNPISMLFDYSRFMKQYADTMQKMSELGEQEMNEAEAAYYLTVTTRITQKLAKVSV